MASHVRRRVVAGITASVVSAVLAACGSTQGSESQAKGDIPEEYRRMVLVGASQGGALYSWAVAASQLFNSELGMETSVQAGATQANALDLESGTITFGLASVSDLISVTDGAATAESIETSELRTLWASVSSSFHVIVGRDTGVESLEDLAGKSVVTGVTGSIESKVADVVLRCVGIESSVKVQNIGKQEGAAAFTDGTVDAWTGLGGKPTASFLETFESNRGARLIGLDDDVRSCVKEEFFDLVDSEMPADTYPGQVEAVPTLDQWFYAVVPADMPDSVAETLARTLAENEDKLVAALPAAIDSTAENTAEFPGFQLHPGTVAALQGIGVDLE